jgi:hypothetical protein
MVPLIPPQAGGHDLAPARPGAAYRTAEAGRDDGFSGRVGHGSGNPNRLLIGAAGPGCGAGPVTCTRASQPGCGGDGTPGCSVLH